MKKKVLLIIALILAGLLPAPSQNNVTIAEQLNSPNASFSYPNFETQKLPTSKKSKSGQDWWEPDTVYCYTTSGYEEYGFIDRFIFKYNSQGLLEEDVHQFWINNSWIDYSINTYTYTYDSNNNILTKLTGNSSQSVYTYDPNNNMLTELQQNLVNNSWINSTLRTYTYDSNNNVLTKLYQGWSNNSWINSSLDTYTYDSNNNLETELQQFWENNSWVGSFIITNTYTCDSNNNVLTKIVFNEVLYTYTYDSNNIIVTELIQRWINNVWENFEQYLRTYDENGNGTSVEYWRWLGENWQRGDNTMIGLRLYYNNMQSYFWGGDGKMTASYIKVSDLTSIAKPSTIPELNAISIYPNPTTGELRIRNYELEIKDIQVFDVMGRSYSPPLEWPGEVNISHLPAGTYFVQVTTEKGVVTKKVVKK